MHEKRTRPDWVHSSLELCKCRIRKICVFRCTQGASVHQRVTAEFQLLRVRYVKLRLSQVTGAHWMLSTCVEMLRRNCSQTFSVRLRPSPFVPVHSPPFYHILSYYPILLRPLFVPSVSVLCFRYFRLILFSLPH